MAAETMHPYQRNDYEGTDVIKETLAGLKGPEKSFPLLNAEQLAVFHALRSSLEAYDIKARERILKDTMVHFRETGDFLIIFDAPSVGPVE